MRLLADPIHRQDFPQEAVFTDQKSKKHIVQLSYALDWDLQAEIEKIFRSYKPDYAAFVALDATTGQVRALVSYNPIDPYVKDHLALRSTFPSASIFKVVTAAAAISANKANTNTLIAYNGRPHTLYRNNVLKDQNTRWTVRSSLRDAFAKSINTVFGKLGVFIVGPTELRDYASRFGFDEQIPTDVPMQIGRAHISEDPWELAEAASGYTIKNTMSPLQGAMIAATIVNDGKMMIPYLVENARLPTGEIVYEAQPKLYRDIISPEAAFQVRELMRETIRTGTSRSAFKGFTRGRYGLVDAGGKTGSLTGNEPKGKYDWFVGYASLKPRKMAFATLIISKEYWKVKSAYVTRKAIEHLFEPEVFTRKMAGHAP